MISLKTFAKTILIVGWRYGRPGIRGRGITEDLEKQDSNNFYSFKTCGDKEEMG